MDDNQMDLLLQEAGEAFRGTHTRAAEPRAAVITRGAGTAPDRSRRWLLPAGAAAATAVVVIGLAVAIPDDSGTRRPAAAVSVPLAMNRVKGIAVSADWLAVAGGDYTATPIRERIDLRRRSTPGEVAATVTTTYDSGLLLCPALDGDTLLWTDVAAPQLPGPGLPWSLWERDLRTGETRQLDTGAVGAGALPCPRAGQGWAAWSTGGDLSARDLSAGFTYTRPDPAVPVAITPAGLLATTRSADEVTLVLRTGESYGTRKVVRALPAGSHVAAAGERAVVQHDDPVAGGPPRTGTVRSCTIPACSDLTELARGPVSVWPVVGDGFVAWRRSGAAPEVVRFDGGAAPSGLPAGLVVNEAIAAAGDTLVYATLDGEPRLHVVRITSRS